MKLYRGTIKFAIISTNITKSNEEKKKERKRWGEKYRKKEKEERGP